MSRTLQTGRSRAWDMLFSENRRIMQAGTGTEELEREGNLNDHPSRWIDTREVNYMDVTMQRDAQVSRVPKMLAFGMIHRNLHYMEREDDQGPS